MLALLSLKMKGKESLAPLIASQDAQNQRECNVLVTQGKVSSYNATVGAVAL